VGLGNPGPKYKYTRHNVGFLFLDYLRQSKIKTCTPWIEKKKYQLFEVLEKDSSILVIKPQTYMNLSGEAVINIAKEKRIIPQEILVIHDDLDIDFGRVKLKFGGGAAGHKGLLSIISCLGSRDFFRLRIGIGRPVPDSKISIRDWVLSPFSKLERDILFEIFEKLIEGLEIFLSLGFEKGSTFINSLKFSSNNTSKKVDL